MKKAFKTVTILFAFVLLSAFESYEFVNGIKEGNEKIEVSFNRTMNAKDLINIKQDLAENGISIEYKTMKFDENGGLKSLDFFVDCNDGFKGGAKNTNIYNQTKWGFYRDYNEKADSPFGTGSLK